jgi:hypothetical protein
MKRLFLAALACLALSACGVDWSHGFPVSSTGTVSCSGGGNGHREQEATARQCRADQTQADVDRQQVIHDQGMEQARP